MLQRKITNSDKKLMSQTAKTLAKQHGGKAVKDSMALFNNHTVIGVFSDDNTQLVSWIVVDNDNNIVFSFGDYELNLSQIKNKNTAQSNQANKIENNNAVAEDTSDSTTTTPQVSEPAKQEEKAAPKKSRLSSSLKQAALSAAKKNQGKELPTTNLGNFAQDTSTQKRVSNVLDPSNAVKNIAMTNMQTEETSYAQQKGTNIESASSILAQKYQEDLSESMLEPSTTEHNDFDDFDDFSDFEDFNDFDDFSDELDDLMDFDVSDELEEETENVDTLDLSADGTPIQDNELTSNNDNSVPGFIDYASAFYNQEQQLATQSEMQNVGNANFVDYSDYTEQTLTNEETSSFFEDVENSDDDDFDDLSNLRSAAPTIESASVNAHNLYGAEAAGLTTHFDTIEEKPTTDHSNEITDELMEAMPSMRGEKARQEKENKGHLLRTIIIVIVVLAVLAVAGFFGFKYLSDTNQLPFSDNGVSLLENGNGSELDADFSKYNQVSPESMDKIKITAGDTILQVRQKLLDIGMVAAARTIAEVYDSNEEQQVLRTGNYIILGSESSSDLVKRFTEGDLIPDGVIGVNEGDTIQNIANNIEKANLPYGKTDFLEAVRKVDKYKNEFSMLADVPRNLPSLEGYLYSDEYNLNAAPTAEDAVRMMMQPMQKWFEDLKISSSEWHDILTKASMIEKEAMFDEDRYLIASVIENRLDKGMNLQIDATVKYANGSDAARVMESDLEVDSPYNTYRVFGLPVGPICSGVTMTDVNAVMNPEDSDYLFYVLKDTEGHHVFCKTLEEFEVAKQDYLELFGYDE